jgi:L-threonylcarbamoyladenylate synthase
LVAYPTEAVYGLGCDPLNGEAVERLLELKGRARTKGVILIAAEFEQLRPYVALPPPEQLDRALASWPGPVTWIFPARPGLPGWLTGGRPTVAVRVTDHPLAAALCRAFGGPLVSTSANRSGQPPARAGWPLRLRFGCALDAVLEAPLGGRSRPSEIRDLATGELLRAG